MTLETRDLATIADVSRGLNDLTPDERHGHVFPKTIFNSARSKKARAAEPTFTAQELATAVEEACRRATLEGETQAKAALAAELNHRQIEALEAIRDQLRSCQAALDQCMSDAVTTAYSLATMIGKTVVPKALELQPLADIGDMIRRSLLRLVDLPTIELRLESELVEPIIGQLSDIVSETGFQGELTIVADQKLGIGDAKLVWKSGRVDRDLRRIQEEVDTLIDAWLRQQDGQPSSLEQAAIGQTATPSTSVTVEHHPSEERSTS